MNRKISLLSMAAVLTACMVFTGCKKDDDDKGAAISGNLDITLEGVTDQIDEVRMLAWTGDEKSEQIATAKVTNGNLSITLPDVAPAGTLGTLGNMTAGITVSDPALKSCNTEFIAYKNGNQVGYIYYGKTDGENETEVSIIYADRDCSISGTYTDTEDKYIDQYNNFNLKKGWNYIVYIEKGKDSSGNDVVESTTSLPSGLKWYFEGYGN
ncbi:MAG: hypothetical protein LBV26_08480 [Bacteroidales bacterium]|jgi:hypothetical protein|nr:hypothetical protein [Bacteroidales bacterium]